MNALAPGTCRHCKCHGESCTLVDGGKCGWIDRSRTVCNAQACMRAELARARAARAARPRPEFAGWGYGARCIEMRKQRRKRRGKGKAA